MKTTFKGNVGTVIFMTVVCLAPWGVLILDVVEGNDMHLLRDIIPAFFTAVILPLYYVLVVRLSKNRKASRNDNESDLEISYRRDRQLTDRKEGDIFPKSIDSLEVINYVCKYQVTEKAIPSWQTELVVKYGDDDLRREIHRLESISAKYKKANLKEISDMPVYADTWDLFDCYQYALVDEKEKRVVYMYMQNIKNTDVIIDRLYLPQFVLDKIIEKN